MIRSISRRSLLAGAGVALAGTTAGQMLTAVARAQDAPAAPASSSLCMTMLFMAGQKARFDSGKYVKKHLPLLREVYGDSVERIEVRSAAAGQGMMASILGCALLYIRDPQDFGQKLGANAERINKDLDAVAKGNRVVQVERIGLELGSARSDITVKSQVYSMFYPSAARPMRGMPGMMPGGGRGPGGGPPGGRGAGGAAPGGASPGEAPAGPPPEPTFDQGYFVREYLPRLFEMYGSDAVSRIEALLGQEQGGQKPTHLASYHTVINDRGAYDKKSRDVMTEIMKDSGKLTTIFPLMADMRVNGIA